MMNLYIYCEGQTEESFIRHVLQDRLAEKNIFVTPIIATTKRTGLRKYSGGTVPYNKLRTEIKNLCANKAFYTTTMFDYYALPQDVPGRKNPIGASIYEKAAHVESEWQKDIGEANFIPNVIMHEFEGMLFSEPDRFSYVDARPMKLKEVQAIREQFETPEHINDSASTAPSKRIIDIYPEYDKVLHGTQIAIDIGYDSILKQCKHFCQWIHRLESFNE